MTYLYLTLATIWALAWACTWLWLIYYFAFKDRVYFMLWMTVIIGIPTAVCMAVIPFLLIDQATGPTLATLKKSQWVCTNSRIERHYQTVLVGRVTTVMPRDRNVCTEYKRLDTL